MNKKYPFGVNSLVLSSLFRLPEKSYDAPHYIFATAITAHAF
ncbi:hypothetical protein [Simonsiella muelleri]|nr:hypothetical protein [Simonsiella muelleri]